MSNRPLFLPNVNVLCASSRRELPYNVPDAFNHRKISAVVTHPLANLVHQAWSTSSMSDEPGARYLTTGKSDRGCGRHVLHDGQAGHNPNDLQTEGSQLSSPRPATVEPARPPCRCTATVETLTSSRRLDLRDLPLCHDKDDDDLVVGLTSVVPTVFSTTCTCETGGMT